MIRRFAVPLVLSALAVPGAAAAQSDIRWSADIYGSGGWSANPYAGNGGQAGYVQLGVRPQADWLTARNSLKIAADIQVQQYFRIYPTQDNYNASLDYSGRPTETLTTNAHFGYGNTVAGTYFDGSLIGPPTTPDTPPPTTGADIGLFGTGNRRETIEGRGGFGLTVSSRDQLIFSGSGASTTNTRGLGAANYVTYAGTLGYSRRVNERLKLGLTGSVTRSDYETSFSNTNVYAGQATFDVQLNERWKLTGAVGASFVDFGNTRSGSTTISGNVQLCSDGEYDQICLGGARSVLPSSTGGTRVQTTVEGNYRVRVSPHGSVTLHGAFTQANGDVIAQLPSNRYYAGSVSYGYEVNRRLRLNTSGFFRKVSGSTNVNGDDYGAQIGFVYTIGDKR